jgi:hypothetical protein
MILSIFIVLIIVSLAVLVIGQYLSAPPLQIAGYVMGFILGLTLMLGGVTYASGEITYYDYVCGCCQNMTFVYQTNISYECIGTPYSCDAYDGNELDCLVAGCVYDTGLEICSGTPDECIVFDTSRDCSVVGCEWNITQSSTADCENESLVVKTENVTTTYTNYSGEVVQGVMLHHIFGLLLCLLSALGFIVVLMNLKSGLPGDNHD